MLEHESDRAVGAEITTVLAECVAHLSYGTGAVVGKTIDHDRGAADAVAFIADLFVIHAVQFANTALDGALDIIFRHIGFLRLIDGQAQAWVHAWITPTQAGSDGDFL